MAHLDYRTNQATDPETLDDMERFIGMLSPLHRYTLMLMTADAIATEDYPCAEEVDEENGDRALTCPHCLDTITEVTHLDLDITATPADFTSPSRDDLVVHHRVRTRRAPLLTWQCPECLNPISLPPEVPVVHTGSL